MTGLPALAAGSSLWTEDTLARLGGAVALTLELAAAALALALVAGLLVALGRLSRRPWLRWPATAFVEVVRGVPLIVFLLWIYFGLFSLPAVSAGLRGLGIERHEIPAAILAFALCYSAFIGETYRAGIQSVDRGQEEAARALGMNRAQAMRHVVLPQAVRNVLPALGNESIALLKDTSLAMVIAVPELMMVAKQEASRSYRTLEVYSAVAVIYLVLTLILSAGQRHLERRYGAAAHPAHRA